MFITLACGSVEAYSQLMPQSFRDGRSNATSSVVAARENYVNKQLNLSDEEAAKFWPVYRRYHQEVSKVRRAKRLNMSNTRSDDQIKKDLAYDEQLVNIKKHYNEEFLKILPPEKVSRIYRSEREFTDELIKQLGERGNNQ